MLTHNVPATLGALLLGSLFATLLSGIVDSQAFIYFRSYRGEDSWRKRAFAGCIWFLNTLHTASIWSTTWFYVIQHYGQHDTIDITPWGIGLTVAVSSVITVSVHIFFAYRIFLLSQRKWLLILPIILLCLARLGFSAGVAASLIRLPTYDAFNEHASWLLTLILCLLTSTDIFITTCLIYFLFKSRTQTSSSINEVLNILMRDIFKNGFMNCVGAVSSMICWLAMPDTLVFLSLFYIIGKLYSNSFFALLNVRENLRRKKAECDVENLQPPADLLARKKRPSSTIFPSSAGGMSSPHALELEDSGSSTTSPKSVDLRECPKDEQIEIFVETTSMRSVVPSHR